MALAIKARNTVRNSGRQPNCTAVEKQLSATATTEIATANLALNSALMSSTPNSSFQRTASPLAELGRYAP